LLENNNHNKPKDGKEVLDFFRYSKDNKQDISELYMTIYQIKSGMEFSIRRSKEANVEPRQSMAGIAFKDRHNKYFFTLLNELQKTHGVFAFRKARGDGNCYYRSVIYGLLEDIIIHRDHKRLTELRNILANAKNVKDLKELLTYKKRYTLDSKENIVQPIFYETFASDLDILLQKIDATIANFKGEKINNFKSWVTKEDFEYEIISSEDLDRILILTCKVLEANWLIINQDEDSGSGLTFKESCITDDMLDYCKEQTMRWERSAEGPAIEKGALAHILHIILRIIVRSKDTRYNMEDKYNTYNGKNIIGSVTCFLIPGHYDLLYVSGGRSVQPNSFNKQGGGKAVEERSEWACEKCTFINKASNAFCDMCQQEV
jgi:hypothetical protein